MWKVVWENCNNPTILCNYEVNWRSWLSDRLNYAGNIFPLFINSTFSTSFFKEIFSTTVAVSKSLKATKFSFHLLVLFKNISRTMSIKKHFNYFNNKFGSFNLLLNELKPLIHTILYVLCMLLISRKNNTCHSNYARK